MAKIGQQIFDKALEILEQNPEGVRHAELIRRVEASDASFQHNYVVGRVVALVSDLFS
jgi:hypothetical protein